MPVFWWVGLNSVFLVGSTMSRGVFWGELSMTLGSLSANGWGVFLSCWLFGIWRLAPELAVLWVDLGHSIEMVISGRPLAE